MLELDTFTLKEATEQVGGSEQLLQELSEKFRQWLQQQLHLPQEISDQRLQYTIIASKFDYEKAKRRLDSHYTFRNLVPELYANRDPLGDRMTQFHKCMQWVPLPKLTPEKYRVVIARIIDTDSSEFDVWDALKFAFMIHDVRAEEDKVNSDITIWDCSNIRLGHAVKFTPNVLKKVDVCLETYGIRVKGVYVINVPNFVERIVTAIKAILSQKVANRVKVFATGMESLYDVIPKSMLPVDYGGEEQSMNALTDMWRARLAERRDWLLEQEKVTANESLRSNSVINADDLFGVPGTFRKLEID